LIWFLICEGGFKEGFSGRFFWFRGLCEQSSKEEGLLAYRIEIISPKYFLYRLSMEVKFKLLVFNGSRNSSLVREPGIPSFPLVGLAPLPRVQLLSSRGMGRFIIK
jgi:hypothetical protein